ncbi:putative modulator of DNA gyrase [Actinomadura rubteroloni]|uniref:Putative modulator of DNA gyrase n=1 Tax=Actinomadura rubteroloni TaxID=1926885 RepID=A0A2P4UB39_9ACTN|nr:metallopeptidase TldD-related protein [Actinomadura rubteroloni]POM22255.1 putative modulator of DNA gyrase [Actinomadura rubteroloni]
MSTLRPQEAVERALALSRSDDCIVIADEASTANLRFAGNTLTTNGVTRSARLTVIALRSTGDGVASGVVSRAAVTADGIEDLVRAAEAVAAGAEAAEDAAPLVPPGDAAAGGGWDDPPGETGIGVYEGVAPALGEAFARAAAEDRRLYGFANHTLTSSFLGTSAGLRLRHDQPTGLLELNAKGAGGSVWTGAGTRDFTDVDVAALTGDLARRQAWGERRIDLPAGRYETLLPPSAVADLMIYLYWSAGARDAHDGRTVFSAPGGGTRVGEKLSPLPLTLSSDPGAAGLECSPFVLAHASGRESSVFDNGTPLTATDWISGGTLSALTQTRDSARRTGLAVTPAIDNLIMTGGDGGASLDDMIARTERGLLLTCLWYIREVDPQRLLLTGLTRDGVFLVEDGAVVGAVNNFRFNESPVDLLGRVTEAGATAPTLPREWSDYFTRAAMPPLRVPDFNMSTVSQAS